MAAKKAVNGCGSGWERRHHEGTIKSRGKNYETQTKNNHQVTMLHRGFKRILGSSAVLLLPPVPPQFRIPYGAEEPQFGDLRMPEEYGPYPVAVILHGGFWQKKYDSTYMSHLCAALGEQGIATWNVEYRQLEDPGGGWPGTFQDLQSGIGHLWAIASRYRLDLDNLVLLGHGSGGLMALWYAKGGQTDDLLPWDRPPLEVKRVITLAPLTDLQEAVERNLGRGKVRGFLPNNAGAGESLDIISPCSLLPIGVPQTILHGDRDRIVPIEMSETYLEEAERLKENVELIRLQGAGHYHLVDPASEAGRRTISVVCDALA